MGNVFMSSPEETAQGEFGVYDVDGALLTLEGSVVLTRDENVVRGERLRDRSGHRSLADVRGGAEHGRRRARPARQGGVRAAARAGRAGGRRLPAPPTEPSPPKATE